jgi:hypothetical protein
MYNRLQAIRAAIFGISFSFFCLCVGIASSLPSTYLLIMCIGLAMLTLCVTWIRLKPNIIYGGLHSFIWFMGMAVCGAFNTLLPFVLSLFVSVILFLKMDQILLFLHNLGNPMFIVGNTSGMPKQAEPEAPRNNSAAYQEGYQWQKPVGSAHQGDGPEMPYQGRLDAQERMQVQYPEMRQ